MEKNFLPFLKNNGITDFPEIEFNKIPPEEWIYEAFDWDASKEGFSFWAKLHYQWGLICEKKEICYSKKRQKVKFTEFLGEDLPEFLEKIKNQIWTLHEYIWVVAAFDWEDKHTKWAKLDIEWGAICDLYEVEIGDVEKLKKAWRENNEN
jgi:hypothetical protein